MTDCCDHEGPERGDARFDIEKVADGVYAAVAAPAYKVNCNTAIIAGRDWLRTFRSYVHDMVEAVRQEVAAGATLDEVKQRVPAKLAPAYEKPFSKYGEYRPWRAGLLANIERTFAMVS